MDFIKETIEKKESDSTDNLGYNMLLSDNVEMLMLNVTCQMQLATKLLSVISNGKILERLGVKQLKDGASWNKDFPISKVMMQSMAMDMLENAKELMRVVLEELEDGMPDITEYNVNDNKHKIGGSIDMMEDQFTKMVDVIREKQSKAMLKASLTQDPN